MGDRRKRVRRVRFDGKLRLEIHGAKITSDAGLLPFRELDEAFRLTEAASAMFSGSRRGKNRQHTLLAMLRQAVYGRLAGYEDVNDAERLRVDPAMRRVAGAT
ncbi:MAG: transposase [Planctomycetes bacterium]|nr:transposase [Planctomycetota bacterium]